MTWHRFLLGATLAAAIALPALVRPAQAGAGWVDEWRALAAKTGYEGHKKFAELLADPDAIALVNDWDAFRGYSARSLVAAAKLPPELKPGLEITAADAGKYPWLKDYLPKPSYERLVSTDWFRWKKIRIVPTTPYVGSRARLEATRKAGPFTISPKGELLNAAGKFAMLSDGGLPFVHPKDGLELYWAFLARGVGNDNASLKPMTLQACLPDNRVERTYVMHLWWQKMHGRVDVPPLGDIRSEDDTIEAGSIVFLAPRDIKGLAAVRRRYASADKPDDFISYVPTMKRTRILGGTDTQDPMTPGIEATWDEWRQSWLKPDPRKFEFKIVGETFILSQPEVGEAYDPAQYAENQCEIETIDLELRPVWILDVLDKTGNYTYGRRRLYIDKELEYAQYQEMYDQRGNLWRVLDDALDFQPKTGLWMARNYVLWNAIGHRFNRITMEPDWSILQQDMRRFMDIDRLRDY
ncbi:outer membrane lipoprotein-sorting protein [Zavarzinia sp.]|uniref:outer membrane lipoprotein-sorting protein n=1 Tax=Zavarzinia sp. TaxID=2027920 RepID=UPI00356AD21B